MAGLGETIAALKQTGRTPAFGAAAPAARLREIADLHPNPGGLRMLLHTPDGLARGAPLVVVLHGCTQTAEAYAEGAGWLALADRAGFAVLCPEQTRANNPNLCFNWFQPDDTTRETGEAASIAAMVRRAITDHGLDPARVFVTGLSAGGAMTAAMLATYPEMFAGGAIIAGLPYGAASNMQEAFMAMFQGVVRTPRDWGDRVRSAALGTKRWPRVSIWHGDADATVKPVSAEALVQQWTDVHGLSGAGAPATSIDGRPYRVWRAKAGEAAAVELHRIPGMAHGTPLSAGGEQGLGAAGPFLLEVGVSSTLEIARGWGLVGASLSKTSDARPAPELSRQPGKRPSVAAGPPELGGLARVVPSGAAEVITKALRSAGLMK